MTSKIVVNNIEADAGVSTVTFDSNVQRGSSNFHSVGVEVAGVNVLGADTPIGTGSTIYNDGGARFSGIVTATSFVGDGSGLTGAGPTLSSGSNDRVITATGTNALLGEANLTFSGSVLNINGTSDDTPLMIDTTSNNGAHLRFRKDGSNQHFVGSGGGFSLGDKEDLSLRGYDNILFASGNSSTERMKIASGGIVTKPNQPSFEASYPDGYTSSGVSHHITTWLRVHHNIGSHFSANNGRFTAPVDGRYLFSVHMTNVGHASPHIAFTINDGTYAAGPSRSGTDYTETWHISEGSGGGVNLTHIFDLSANDYVRASTWNYTGTGDDPRCYFCGYLLG